MAAKAWPSTVLVFYCFFLVSISSIPLSSSQPNSPQNIQTSYPFPSPPIALNPTSPPPLPPPPPSQPAKSSSKDAVVKAVAATAAATFVLSGLLFFLLQRYLRRRKEQRNNTNHNNPYNYGSDPVVGQTEFTRFKGNLKGVIVDEDGLDVLYWRNLGGKSTEKTLSREEEKFKGNLTASEGDKSKKKPQLPVQEIPLLRGKSSTSHQVWPEIGDGIPVTAPPQPPSPPPSQPPPPPAPLLAIPKPNTRSSVPPPPPPSLQEIPLLSDKSSTSGQTWPGVKDGIPITAPSQPSPPLPPPPPPQPPATLLAIPKPNMRNPKPPPPPPPIPSKRGSAPPPPPPKAPGLASSFKPPPAPKGIIPSDSKRGGESSSGQGMAGDGNGQVKLKPLHWDKVNPNVDHSMVWDKIDGGSFRFDDDLMEALFGSVATNRKSPRRNNHPTSPKSERSNAPSKVFILDARKSQNTAIVLRSLAISRKEIIDALVEGQGLDTETLEKLTKIAPTKEEESKILAFNGDPTKLADAESFLHHLLRSVPSAFARFDAMLFRSTYDSEILQMKNSLQTLELGCKELRTRGLFLKLLEAILKAGNRMNAGTSRGNAQAFNLSALRKLSDVKSIDGKTTLLHFVVEEVVRSEGKRCAMNRNRSLSRSSTQSSNGSTQNSDNSASTDERERDYIMLGLPVVGGLSSEFSNLKKAAATVDYDSFAKTGSVLAAGISETQGLLIGDGGGEGFVREMKGFLEIAEEELKAVKEEQTRVMGLVKGAIKYYQAGASKDMEKNPLQLFVIVKDFLSMVDQACIDIATNLQKRKNVKTNVGSSSPKSPAKRVSVKFPVLPENFMPDKMQSTSSESDDEF
ncbi:hypothetical protein U1Q18_016979 [Sarracenia purpurea var. burkii]